MSLIERQAAIDIVMFECGRWTGLAKEISKQIQQLPSAQLEPCEDAVSRLAAIDILDAYQVMVENGEENPYAWARLRMSELPSAQPERKTGHWLIREGISDAQCSECGMYFRDIYDMENSDAFCRHCGTKMEGLKVVKRG